MMRTLGVCAFLLLVSAVGSQGNPFPQDETSGNFLLASCQLTVKSVDDTAFAENHFEAYRDGYCRGLIEGVSDASSKVCPAHNVSYGQEFRIVLKYLQDHPEELHLKNSLLVDKALASAFPCGK